MTCSLLNEANGRLSTHLRERGRSGHVGMPDNFKGDNNDMFSMKQVANAYW